MELGIHIISPLAGDWHGQQLPLIKRGRFSVGKAIISGSAATAPENVEQFIDVLVPGANGRKTIILRTDDTLRPWSSIQRNAVDELRFEFVGRGFRDLVSRRADVDWYLEVLNEPDLAGTSTSQTLEWLRDAIRLKAEFGPRVSWIASLPTTIEGATACIKSGATDGYDALGCHLYGDYALGDGGYDWPEILDLCLAQDRAVWITEAGINDAKQTTKRQKAQRVLSWMAAHRSPRLVGLCVFVEAVGSAWPQYEIDANMADVFARRVTVPAPPAEQPPATPPSNKGGAPVATVWYPAAKRASTPYQSPGIPNGRRFPATVTDVVMHHTAGSYASAISWFASPGRGDNGTSAHFIISRGGEVTQMVALDAIAWHAGSWPENVKSIGIEHEQSQINGRWQDWPDALLDASAKLLAWLRSQMTAGFNVRPHSDFTSTDCPGDLPIGEIVRRSTGVAEKPKIDTQSRWFAETRHYVALGFLAFYESHDDALALFGYPLSEEFTNASGKTIQWFERARFEWNPEYFGNPWNVQLGRLGADAMASDRNQFPAAFADAEPPK